MGGKTSSKSKNAHTRKAYDRLTLIVQKGLKGYYHNEAKKAGKKSFNAYVIYCMDKEIEERRKAQGFLGADNKSDKKA